MKTCPITDEELLLAVHGELSPAAAVKVAWHVSRCASCRSRKADFKAAAVSTAAMLRETGMRPWRPGDFLANALTIASLTVVIAVAIVSLWMTATNPQIVGATAVATTPVTCTLPHVHKACKKAKACATQSTTTLDANVRK
ncbi:MAG TPA: hypothetical protein VGK19_15930 [Capsulimonadaceae bacterium]|jgi:anti-sigma factor RsiW